VVAHPQPGWPELLRGLYEERRIDGLMADVSALLKKYRGQPAFRRPMPQELTERDVVLITYPDQIREDGVRPLRTLSDFCERRLDGLIRCLHVLPFYPSSSDDGFSVVDYRQVDPDLGSWEDVSRLGMKFRLMQDLILNHTSVRHAWFQSFLGGEYAFRDFFIEVHGSPDLSKVVRPRPTPLVHRCGEGLQAKTVWTTFSADQADLNYRSPRVLMEMADILLFFIARGAAILRLDAVAYLWKETGTACISLPQTHRIVQWLRALVDEAAPGVKLVTETNVPHAENLSYFGDGNNEAHLVYNFALPPLLLHALHTGDCSHLARWVETLFLPGRKTAFLNFLASHDGIGLNAVRGILPEEDIQRMADSALGRGGKISYKAIPGAGTQPYELNINYFDALSDPDADRPADLAVRRFLAAHAVLLSLAGVPAIYFHSLFGSQGWIEGVRRTGLNRSINRQKFDRAEFERELDDPSGLRNRIFSGMSRLITARMRSPAFDPYGTQRIADCGRSVFALWRFSPRNNERVLCLHNVTDREQEISLTVGSDLPASTLDRPITDLISGAELHPRRLDPFRLEPYQACWLQFDADRTTKRNLPA
jgi:glycosidase